MKHSVIFKKIQDIGYQLTIREIHNNIKHEYIKLNALKWKEIIENFIKCDNAFTSPVGDRSHNNFGPAYIKTFLPGHKNCGHQIQAYYIEGEHLTKEKFNARKKTIINFFKVMSMDDLTSPEEIIENIDKQTIEIGTENILTLVKISDPNGGPISSSDLESFRDLFIEARKDTNFSIFHTHEVYIQQIKFDKDYKIL